MNKLIYTHYYYNDEKDLGIPLETSIEITDKITITTKYINIKNIKEIEEDSSTFELPNNLWDQINEIDLSVLEDEYNNGEELSTRYKVVLNDKVIEGNYFPEGIKDLRYLLNIKEIIKAESLRLQEKVREGD